MDYFLSHIGTIFVAGLLIGAVAVIWWYLMEKNAKLKRERLKAKMNDNSTNDNLESTTNHHDEA